jgi:regulator of protease activity HflC (stomatin/prohibitin superfamily)
MGQSLEEVRLEFQSVLTADLDALFHITLVSVSINDVDAGSEIEQIIQDKAKAIQEIQIAQQEQAKQAVINETNRIKAETEAQIALIKANSDLAVAEKAAEAQAVLNAVAVTAIQTMYAAQFEDEAVRIEFETNATGGYLTIQEISTIVVKQLYYDVWDGKLPTVVTDGSGIIIQP